MKVLFVKWKAYGQELLQKGVEETGISVDTVFYDAEKYGIEENCGFMGPLYAAITRKDYEFVISFNYFPVVSAVCEKCHIKYVAWTVDSPLYTLYTHSIYNKCNYLFVFDKTSLMELKDLGVEHVWYLPLASDADYFDKEIRSVSNYNKYASTVSFVGSLYTDKSAYSLIGKEKDYFAGYMEGLVEAQRKLWGYNFVEKILHEKWSKQLENMLNPVNGKEFIGKNEKVFANSCIMTEITARERKEYLEYISQAVDVDIYTGSDTTAIPVLHNRGKVDYLTEMPLVFHNSKINLNITLRTIQQGISLRVWDVLASGGFLLTNYQPELEEFFEIGNDLECFVSKEDMLYKIEYYLEHEEERKQIAQNGYNKVKQLHSYKRRMQAILEILNDKLFTILEG